VRKVEGWQQCQPSLFISRKRRQYMSATQVPVWEKFTLTIEEAAAYFRIGETKLRQIVSENRNADFLLWNGNRPQIKRKKFEALVDELHNI
jgi:hypothetical protein